MCLPDMHSDECHLPNPMHPPDVGGVRLRCSTLHYVNMPYIIPFRGSFYQLQHSYHCTTKYTGIGILPITTTCIHIVHTTTCVYNVFTGTIIYNVYTVTLLFLLHQDGESALDYARRDDRTDLIAYLEELGESIVLWVDCITYIITHNDTASPPSLPPPLLSSS